MIRFQYARCGCGCDLWVVVDTFAHAVIGVTESAWDASRAAMRLNLGRPVYREERRS